MNTAVTRLCAFALAATLVATSAQAQFRTPAVQELWVAPSVSRSIRYSNYTATFSPSFLDLRIERDVSRMRVVIVGDETNAPIETTVGEIREALRQWRVSIKSSTYPEKSKKDKRALR